MPSHTRQGYKKGTTSQKYNTRAHFGSEEFLFLYDEITNHRYTEEGGDRTYTPLPPCAKSNYNVLPVQELSHFGGVYGSVSETPVERSFFEHFSRETETLYRIKKRTSSQRYHGIKNQRERTTYR